jgi:antitoxin component YwqK of YwqJK toxin-antitoxin module
MDRGATSSVQGYAPVFLILAILSLLLLSNCDTKQEDLPELNQRELVTNASKGLVLYQDKPFTGTSVNDYPNGTRAQAIDYLAGRKHGVHRKWFEDGSLSFEAHYEDGRQHGQNRSWWRNGNPRSTSQMERGVGQGLQQQWYASGAQFKEIRLVNGRESGLQRSWRENGKLYNNYEARNGRIFGLKRANLCFSLEDEVVQIRE